MSENEDEEHPAKTTEIEGKQGKPIFIVHVPKGRAIDILYLIRQRARVLNLPIYSAFVLDKHPDLVYVEADDFYSVAQAIAYFRYARAYESPISPLEYEELMRSLEEILKQSKELEEKKQIEFQVGQIVRIIRGPFKDRQARIVSVSKSKLFLDLMGGATLIIEVKPEDVEPVSE
mgnify:CR=1 FL=1